MKIGMMSAWNTDSGVAVHAEPVGKAWREMGHELTVFSFTKKDFHGEGFTSEDEGYVIRCFGTQETNFLDPRPILTATFDIFVVQDLNMLPLENLAKIFPLIRKKAKTVHIVHENTLPKEAWFYQLDWDGVIYFCRRQNFLKEIYPQAKLIHFPCFPVRRQDKLEARKRLGLPLDKKIIYEFCQRGYRPFLRELPEKLKKKAVLLFVIPTHYEFLEEHNPPSWMVIRREETLSHEKFDDYLFASDAVILHKFQSRYHAVVSSTAFQALGTGCPILVPGQSDFFFPFKEEVIRYGDVEDLKKTLVDLVKDGERYKALQVKAEEFVKKNSPEKIAEEHIKLFLSLMKRGGAYNKTISLINEERLIMLEKFEGNPILKPIPEHSWESKCVFNCASFYDEGKVHIVYRAVGKDNISRLGYASSLDGFKIDERLPKPIFSPEGKFESNGCEDPRITRVGEEYYMFYTAYSSYAAQIGQVAIKVVDFLAKKWEWGKRNYPFPRVNNKDVALFPEKIKGKWVLYHRIPPHVWVAYSNDLVHWENSNIVIMPRGTGWEKVKVGAGAPPIKTPRGWLFIYHAIDEAKIYRLGLALISLNDPEEILYRSKEPILVPDKKYERKGNVPNVVFTCGAFVKDERLFVHYGGADTVICVATQRLNELLP